MQTNSSSRILQVPETRPEWHLWMKLNSYYLHQSNKEAPVSRQDQEAFKSQEFVMHESVNVQGWLTSKGALQTELTITQAQGQKIQGTTTILSPSIKLLIELEALLGHMTEDQPWSPQQGQHTWWVCFIVYVSPVEHTSSAINSCIVVCDATWYRCYNISCIHLHMMKQVTHIFNLAQICLIHKHCNCVSNCSKGWNDL